MFPVSPPRDACLADEARDAQLGGADAVVVAEGAAALAGDHGLHVAGHRAHAARARRVSVRRQARRLRQQRHAVRLEHHLVPLVGLGLQPDSGGC